MSVYNIQSIMIFIEGEYFNYKVFNFSKFINNLFDQNTSTFSEKFFESLVRTDYFNYGLVYLNIENQLEK